ncbi:MAG: FimB/Mfa2 family fimbrial subunit [Tannerellaceae bacterium]|jgi:hypothetical protein|nr:FimB/Mfa2 family fimbrial subunit [Tannerellaceae bacterium]
MTTYHKNILTFLYSCLFILAFAACTEEIVLYTGENDEITNGNETRVSFSIRVPSQIQSTATKSLSDEGAVGKIHILLFKTTDNTRTYSQCISVDNITASSNTQKTFQVTLPIGLYDLVVLANAQEIINRSGISFGDTKDDVLKALVDRNTDTWDVDYIPMWGQIDNRTINPQSDFTGNNAIPMIRMLAKIEVEVTPEAAGENNSNFTLTDIRLYNYSSQGSLVPDLRTWPADNVSVQPSKPAVANGYASMYYPANPPLVFNSRVGYIYEAPAGGNGKAMAGNTCLVVGGSYRGRPVTYYRADFVSKTDPDKFLPLLRNHHYLMKIIKVNADGYPTPELAFETTLANMEVDVLPWNSSSMENVSFDGQNTLEVSESTFTFPNGAQTTAAANNRLTICTSVANGWEIEKITDANDLAVTWLTASEGLFSSPNIPKDIYLLAEENTTSAERTAYVYIRAGRLSFRVTVVQKELFNIRITDGNGNEINELVFPLAGGTENFSIHWTPATSSATVSVSAIGQSATGITGFKGSGYPANTTVVNGGSATYSVRADAYTDGDGVIHRASKVDFTINDGNSIVTRTLFLRQFDFNLIPVVSSYFLMDGGKKKFGIRANTTWEIIDVIDQQGIIANRSELIGKTGGLDITPAGEDVSFGIVNRQSSPSAEMPVATIVFRNAPGTIYNAKITGFSTYEVNNLLVWPVDMPIASTTTWYNLADVPDGTSSTGVPPMGPRNSTVHSNSCAALDPSNKDLWRLPTVTEIHSIFSYFRSNGGYGKYAMANVDYSGGTSNLASITNGYWTAESNTLTLIYYAAYSTTEGKGGRGAIPKNNAGPTFVAEKTWNIYARCVRSK